MDKVTLLLNEIARLTSEKSDYALALYEAGEQIERLEKELAEAKEGKENGSV